MFDSGYFYNPIDKKIKYKDLEFENFGEAMNFYFRTRDDKKYKSIKMDEYNHEFFIINNKNEKKYIDFDKYRGDKWKQ